MSKPGKNPRNSSPGTNRLRKTRNPYVPRIPYVPQAIRDPNSYGPLSQKYDEYIELFDDSSDDSDGSVSRKKAHSEESRKYELETIHEAKSPNKPIIHCYNASRDNISNPLTVKKSAPVKKISFVLPDGKKPLAEEQMDWKDYHRLEVINKFMDDLEANFPSICTTASIGKSVEGRHLKILKISNSNASNAAVWLDAGIHAREWIAPAVNTYIANHITKNFDNLPDYVTNKDWYFLPVVNPDGYHYSHTSDRLWRKSRAFHNGVRSGVDLNRNFSVGWGGKGSSDKPSHAFYRGPHPFSEPETSAMRDVFLKSGINFQVYITLHSYGQIIIFPYSCTTAMAPDYVQLLEGATAMSKAIYKTNGETYKVGISRDVMYASSGTSTDFAHAAAGIPFCYLIELRSKTHKFKLPKEEIEDTGKEILNSVIALMEFVDNSSYQKKEQKIDVQLQETESILNSCDVIKTNSSYLKKRESYDRSYYSYAKQSNSQNQGSYVKLSHVPVDKRVDLSDDQWSDFSDDIYDTRSIRYDPIVTQSNTSEKETEPYNKYNVHLKYTNGIPMGKIKFVNYDSFAKQCETFTNANSTTKFLAKLTESLTDTESSYEGCNSFYEQINNFKESRNDFLHTGATPVLSNIQRNSVKVAPTVQKSQLWEVKFPEEGQRQFVKTLDNLGAIHIWKEERSSMDIMIDASRAIQVSGILTERDIPYTIAIADLTALLEREQNASTVNFAKTKPMTMDWNNYHTLDTIYAFLDGLQAEYPYLCSVQVIGKSAEGRDLKMLKISNGGKSNHGIWMDGAIHPREWISPAVVTYLADRIVRSFNEMPASVTNKDWYILPVLNPDGYVYTHTQDRMWRKNRARYIECVGVDLNRNFSYGFGEKGEEGSSEDPGSLFYRGPKPFSEPETSAVRNAVLGAPTKFKAFLSFHSYGEVIIFPWGYTSDSCPDYVDLLEGGTAMAKAIYGTSGHTYKVGSTKDLMYYASGTSIDWSYAVPNIPYSYMIELRSKTHRFLLPKEEIITTANEIQSGVFRLMDFIDQRCTGTESCACPK